MITVSDLAMRFGGKILFDKVSLQFQKGNRYGLIGPNGSGKTTFLKIVSGEVTPEKGSISLPSDCRIGTLTQDQFRYENQSLIDTVLQGRPRLWQALQKKEVLLASTASDIDLAHALAECEEAISLEDGYAAESEAGQLLEGLGLLTPTHRHPMSTLSGGYKLRVLLAQVLFGRPDVLLLDEPTNHLDLYSIEWLAQYLQQYTGTLVITSHLRDFLNRVCTHIADVDYGTIRLYKGNYDQFEHLKAEAKERKEATLEKQKKKKEDLQGFVDRFRAKASKARQAQSKARIVEKLEKEMADLDLVASSRRYPNVAFSQKRPTGAIVLKTEGITKSYGENKVLADVSFEITKGEKVAIVGPNGIGKSTLLQILMDRVPQGAGTFSWGHAVRSVYFPQDHKAEVYGDSSVLDWLRHQDTSVSEQEVRNLLGRALFTGDMVNQPVNTLSGGEVARLLLAKMMLLQGNVLVFDEPTNHLDMEAIENLIEAIQKFPGTVFMVSHNTHLLSHTATRVIELHYDGVHHYLTNFGEFHHQRLERECKVEAAPEKKGSSSYEERKQRQSARRKIERNVHKLEERCHKLETDLEEVHAVMADPSFYGNTPEADQQKTYDRKKKIEQELAKALAEWEGEQQELDRFA